MTLTRLRQLAAQSFKKIRDPITTTQNYPSFILWISALIAGMAAVFYTQLFHWVEAAFLRVSTLSPYSPLLFSPVMVILAWWIVHKAAPEASGSGIPQILAASDLPDDPKSKHFTGRLLGLKTATVKIISSLLLVLAGGAVGREGPTLQISSSIFYFFGTKVKNKFPQTNLHTWIVAGAASGLAAAFNTPLGGIVYAIEELGLVHFHKIRTALLGAVIFSGLVAQWIFGSYLFLGFPRLTPIGFSTIPPSIFCGLVAGIMGAVFGRVLYLTMGIRLKIRKTSSLLLFTGCLGLVVGALSLTGDSTHGSGIGLVTRMLFSGEAADLTTICVRFLGTIASYLSGAAGGIFSPSLTIGATIGNYLSNWIGTDIKNLMTLLGMIGFLTGVTRTPFTSFILILEMTDRHSAIFPMMISALTAQWAAHWIDSRSFYDRMKDRYLPQ